MTILVTGATGFVGGAACRALADAGHACVAAVRATGAAVPGAARLAVVGDLGAQPAWQQALEGVEVVVHCAARAHVMRERAADALAAYRAVNVHGTLELARAAAAGGVKRLVFLSSIKVNGEETPPGRPFTADDAPAPVDAYGVSKMEAELGLREIAGQTDLEVVIIRPPLVYGPGVKGNFAALIKLLRKGYPLPLGAIDNRRSLIGLDNLVSLIRVCVEHPAAAGRIVLAADGEDLSTPDLLRRLAHALQRPARLVRVPAGVLRAGAGVLGRRALAQRLLGSLQVDTTPARDVLGWSAPVTVDEGLRRACRPQQE